MSPRAMMKARQFRFDVSVEIAPCMAVAGGDLGEFIADGLTALDRKGMLFPGLAPSAEGGWLTGLSIQCTGYERSSTVAAVDAAYSKLMATGRPRFTKGTKKTAVSLQTAAEDMEAALLRMRVLTLRMHGLVEALSTGTASPADIAEVQTLMKMAKAVSDLARPDLPNRS